MPTSTLEHRLVPATELHQPWHVGATDPASDPLNNVAAHHGWADTTSGLVLKKRNAANTGWDLFDAGNIPNNVKDVSFPLAIGHPAASAVIAVGTHLFGVRVPCAGSIIDWTLIGDASATASVDIKKAAYAGWPTTASIWGTVPALAAAAKNQATGLSIAVAAGDLWEVAVTANDNAKQLILNVTIRRS